MAEKFRNGQFESKTREKKSQEFLGDKLEMDLYKYKTLIFSIEWNDGLGNQEESKKLFSEYISGLSKQEKKNFVELMKHINISKLAKFISENGYIINDELSEFFENKFGYFHEKKNNYQQYKQIGLIGSLINNSIIENSTKSGDFYLSDLGQNIWLKVDFRKVPPECIITNGNYELKTDLGVGVFYEPTLRYQRDKIDISSNIKFIKNQINELNEKLEILNGVNLYSPKLNEELSSIFSGDSGILSIIDNYSSGLDIGTAKILKNQISLLLSNKIFDLEKQNQDLQDLLEEREKKYLSELDLLKRKYYDNIGKHQKEIFRSYDIPESDKTKYLAHN